MMREQLRTFLAVDLPPEFRAPMVEAIATLRSIAPDGVRWIPADNLHLTLKFVGGIDAERIPQLISATEAKLAGVEGFSARLGGFGAFPNARAARILWLGVTEGAKQLARLARKLDAAAARTGAKRERRPFHAHLTLGRLRRPGRVPLERVEPPKELPLSVSEVVLYESRLSSTGSEYIPLARLPLRETARELTEFAPDT